MNMIQYFHNSFRKLARIQILMKHLALLLLLICPLAVTSQTHFSILGKVAVPMNEFRDNTTTIGGGIKFDLFGPFEKNSPFFIGGGLGYMIFGSHSERIDEHLDVYAGSTLITSIPITMRVTTTNNLVNGHLSLRYKYPFEYVHPYADIRAGFNYLFTKTTVYDETEDRFFTSDKSDNKINSRTPEASLTYHFGAGGGFIIRLNNLIGLNIGAYWLMGGEAKYYDKSQIDKWTVSWSGQGTFDPENPEDIELNQESANPRKSRTDMLMIDFGITLSNFSKKKKR